MPIPAAIIPAAKMLGTAATRATGQALTRNAARGATNAASKAGTNALARNSGRTAANIGRQSVSARTVTPKKVPSHFASSVNPARFNFSNLKPSLNRLPTSQQTLNFCNKAFQRADQSGLLDIATEVGTNALIQKLTQSKPDSHAPSDYMPSNGSEENDGLSASEKHPLLSAAIGVATSSIMGQIQNALSEYQNQSSGSAQFSEPTINLDENGLRR